MKVHTIMKRVPVACPYDYEIIEGRKLFVELDLFLMKFSIRIQCLGLMLRCRNQ